jgi:hypothetical protein
MDQRSLWETDLLAFEIAVRQGTPTGGGEDSFQTEKLQAPGPTFVPV